jgi:Protein of unknown function (DUF3485)
MRNQKIILAVVVLLLIASGAGGLVWLHAHQRLGEPGIKGRPRPGTVVMDFDLPEYVLDFASTNLEQSEVVTNMLPKDTSFAQRLYMTPDKWPIWGNVILMGTDRTSIHKPEYCLAGQGCTPVQKSEVTIRVAGGEPYDLTVARWNIRRVVKTPRGDQEQHGVYVFWFVAKDEITTSHWERNWWMTRDLMRAGVLQRWAYVSYLALCPPGQEDAAFENTKRLIAASVPYFQKVPRPVGTTVADTRP